jgi:hypothetical protein
VVLPALYSLFAAREVRKEEAPEWV